MKKINIRDIKKILVIKNDKIGDMVLSTNVFRELGKNLPNAKITVITSKVNKALIEKNKNIEKIWILDYPPNNFSDLIKYLKMSKKIKKENFDIGMDLRGSIFNILFFLTFPRIKYSVGFYNRKLSKSLLDFAYKKDRTNTHCTIQRIDLINKSLGFKSKNSWPEIATDKEDKKTLDSLIKEHKLKKFVCLVPDASLTKKQWPVERWEKTIKYIKKKYPKYKILLVGSDRKMIDFLIEKHPYCVPIIRKNLRTAYLLFQKANLTIAHDGGPMHLAWAGRSKLLALFPGYLAIEYYKPLGKNSRIIDKPIKTIKVEEVKKEIDGFLKGWK